MSPQLVRIRSSPQSHPFERTDQRIRLPYTGQQGYILSALHFFCRVGRDGGAIHYSRRYGVAVVRRYGAAMVLQYGATVVLLCGGVALW